MRSRELLVASLVTLTGATHQRIIELQAAAVIFISKRARALSGWHRYTGGPRFVRVRVSPRVAPMDRTGG